MNRPSATAPTVTLGRLWAWALFWAAAAFVPTAFGAWEQDILFAALAALAGLAGSASLTARRGTRR